jgi:hypothetical protein
MSTRSQDSPAPDEPLHVSPVKHTLGRDKR